MAPVAVKQGQDTVIHPHNEPPVNPLPPVVVALFLVIVGIEAALTLGARGIVGGPVAVGWRLETLERFAFSSEIFAWMIETGRWPLEHVFRFVSYAFVHASFTHALFAGVMLLALGKMVGEALGSFAVLVIFFVFREVKDKFNDLLSRGFDAFLCCCV